MLDLSIMGCTIESKVPLLPGNSLRLQFQTMDQEPPIVIDVAIVRTVTGQRTGLEFVRIRPEEGARLRQLLLTLLHSRQGAV